MTETLSRWLISGVRPFISAEIRGLLSFLSGTGTLALNVAHV